MPIDLFEGKDLLAKSGPRDLLAGSARNQTVEEQTGVPEWGRKNPNLYGAYGAGKAIISEVVKPTLETAGFIAGSIASPIVGTALGYGMGKKAGEIVEGQYAKLEKPDLKMKTVGEEMVGSAVDVGSALALGKGMQIATKGALTVDEKLTQAIRKGIEKGIRPSVAGKQTNAQTEQYLNKAETAVKTIIENKANLKLTSETGEAVQELPKNLKQFSQAIDQTKRNIFSQYDKIARTAGAKGAQVNLAPIVQELKTIAADKSVADLSPNIAKYALSLAKRFSKRGSYTTLEAQDAIAVLNKRLESFYKNPSYHSSNQAHVDSMVANRIRGALDDVIEATTGEQYQALKNTYGSLKTVERDVTRRAIVDARKNEKGLIDFSDIFSGHQVVSGILHFNPATIGSGVAAKFIAAYYKHLNNPNRIVRSMFEDAEKLIGKLPKQAPTSPRPAPKPQAKEIEQPTPWEQRRMQGYPATRPMSIESVNTPEARLNPWDKRPYWSLKPDQRARAARIESPPATSVSVQDIMDAAKATKRWKPRSVKELLSEIE